MEKVFGPFNGYLIVVCVAEASESPGHFSASYKICSDACGDPAEASTGIRKRVAGLSGSIDEAFGIALKLARLQVAGLRDRVAAAATPKRKSTPALAEFARSWGEDSERDSQPMTYQPTIACPLEPMASRKA